MEKRFKVYIFPNGGFTRKDEDLVQKEEQKKDKDFN